MVRVTGSHAVLSDEVVYAEYAGKSTDTKPTTFGQKLKIVNGERVMQDIAIATGSLFLEVDTGDIYVFNEEGATGSKWAKL